MLPEERRDLPRVDRLTCVVGWNHREITRAGVGTIARLDILSFPPPFFHKPSFFSSNRLSIDCRSDKNFTVGSQA